MQNKDFYHESVEKQFSMIFDEISIPATGAFGSPFVGLQRRASRRRVYIILDSQISTELRSKSLYDLRRDASVTVCHVSARENKGKRIQ